MRNVWMVVACALLGCAGRGEAPVAAPVAPVVEERHVERHGVKAPFVLTVEGPDDVEPGALVEVAARISRRVVNEIPLLLALKMHEGVSLVEGMDSEEIVDGSATEIIRVYKVRVDDPAAVLVVQATMGGEGFGAVATREHRFRKLVRPATALPMPGAQVRPAQ